MQSKKLWTIYSALLLMLFVSGCSSIERPDANLFGINVPGLRLYGYNLKKDFNDNGKRNPKAKPLIIQFKSKEEMLDYMNKGFMMPLVDFQRTNVFVKEVREYCK